MCKDTKSREQNKINLLKNNQGLFRNTVNNVRKGVNLFSKMTVNHLRKRHMHVMIVIVMTVIKDFGREGGFHAHKYINIYLYYL